MKLLDVLPMPDSVWSVITIQPLAGTTYGVLRTWLSRGGPNVPWELIVVYCRARGLESNSPRYHFLKILWR